MGQFSMTAFVGILALTLTGCSSGGDNSAVNPPNPPQPAPKPFEKPAIVAQNPETRVTSSNGLIQPIVVNERLQKVKQGRQDPFAALFVPVTPRLQTTPKPQKPVSPIPKPPIPTPPVTVTSPPPSQVPTPLPTVAPSPLPPALPPQPELARGVAVLGVVQVGDETQAIVQVPNEATSRYVGEGQRLSNGQVLVKRILVNAGSEPIVVLEENGMEITKTVGEVPSNQGQTTPTAAIPIPPPPPNRTISLEKLRNQGQTTPTAAIPIPSPPPDPPIFNQRRMAVPTAVIPTLPPPSDTPNFLEKLRKYRQTSTSTSVSPTFSPLPKSLVSLEEPNNQRQRSIPTPAIPDLSPSLNNDENFPEG